MRSNVFWMGAALAVGAGATAATVVFDVNTNTGSDPMLYSVSVHDNAPGLLTFALTVAASSANNGDVAALYLNFDAVHAAAGYRASDFSGDAITRVRFNTSNVQAGNIGQEFQFGLGIGRTGSGHDFFDSFSFTMKLRNGLTLNDLALLGVRAQSVGPGSSFGDPAGGSAKTFVERGEPIPEPNPVAVPLPTGAGLAGLGLLIAGTRRRRAAF